MIRTLKVAVFLLSIVVLSVAFAGCGTKGDVEEPSGEAAATIEETGTAPARQAEGIGTEPGQTPPAFVLPDLEGNDVSLSDFEGKVVVLDLWATWCPPCRKEIPFLVSLYEEYKDRGLAVVGVGLDQGGASVIAPFVEANSVTYTILVGDQAISQQYKVSGIPMTLMIDRDGRVASKEVGFAPTMEAEMRARVEELLSRKATEA
ncbi:MAG: TlpA family protein disulfide reductase [Candidatus Aminicenantes bacterium]|nr:MAG: TlpA family protein disulfide reductase [Candidatus Aminicenantes bacterium]